MRIAITGHTNIEKAVGKELKYEHGMFYDKEAFDLVYAEIEKNLLKFCEERGIKFKNLTFISGMARGVDEIFAIMAIRNGLPLILSVPGSVSWHKNRGLSHGMRAQAVYYDKILSYENIVEIAEVKKHYGKGFHFVNMARNQHMVDITDVLFSFKAYDSTGTDDCIKRGMEAEKYIGNLNQKFGKDS